jgi:hypothetical protein
MRTIAGDYTVDVVVTGASFARAATYTLTRLPGRGAGTSLLRRELPELFRDTSEARLVARMVGEAHALRLTDAYTLFWRSIEHPLDSRGMRVTNRILAL